jgi:Na+-transporting methylmalonyl-CoA/oxaloacetate decarboxylase beta subunit
MNNKRRKRIVKIITVLSMLAAIIGFSYKYLLILYMSYKFHSDLSDAASIGVIGGADGPTTIFIAGSRNYIIVPVIFTLISIAGALYLIVTRKKKI